MHQEDSKASLVHCINGKGYEDEVNLLFSISVGLVTKTAPLVWGVKEPTNCLKTVRVVVLVVAMHHSFSIHSFFLFFSFVFFSPFPRYTFHINYSIHKKNGKRRRA